jgi:hypothetical protein
MSAMYFKDKAHQKAYETLIKAEQVNDIKYCSAVYALAAIGEHTKQYIRQGEIDFPALFETAEVWSPSEKALLKLAASLFNASIYPVKVDDVFRNLDKENFQAAIQAIKIRYLGESQKAENNKQEQRVCSCTYSDFWEKMK